MTDTIFPLQVWPEGIAQASVPANENSLREEALRRPCLGIENDVADPPDGGLYIVGTAPTGSFATFIENDLAFSRVTDAGTSWHAWAPTDGLRVWMDDGSQKVYVGESTNEWQDAGSAGSVNWGDIGGTLSSQTDLQSALDGKAQDRRTVTAAASTSGTLAIDCSLGDYFTHALDENVTTWSFSNLPGSGKGATLMIRFTQDSTPRTVAWPSSFKWAGGTPGVVSNGSGVIDVLAITTFDNGTSWDATLAKAFA